MVAIALTWFGLLVPALVRSRHPGSHPSGWQCSSTASRRPTGSPDGNALGVFPSHTFAILFGGLTWFFASGAAVFSLILMSDNVE